MSTPSSLAVVDNITAAVNPGARRLIAAITCVATIAAVIGLGGHTVWAHSGLAAASPGPGAVVGGDVGVIKLFYNDIIVEFDATLTGPRGKVLDAKPVLVDEITAELQLDDALDEPGEYTLSHTVVSFDDDVIQAAYLFTYQPGADPPIPIFLEEDNAGDPTGWNWMVLGATSLVLVILITRLVLSISRSTRRKNRSQMNPGGDS